MTIRSTCISVKPGGKLLAGTKDEPFEGQLQILLSGDSYTDSHQCGGLKGKMFDVNGELSLHGQTDPTRTD